MGDMINSDDQTKSTFNNLTQAELISRSNNKAVKIMLYLFGVLVFLAIGTLGYGYFISRNVATHTVSIEKPEQNSNQEPIKETQSEKEKRGILDYFISDFFPQYPKFQSEIKPESILQVFPLALKKIDENQSRGWLVEVEKDSKNISHYLLTPILEKELVDSMSCVSQDENPPIELEKVETVGNELRLGRDLQEKSGYIILSGAKNSCYGGANSGFVSVYNIRTGEKIKFQGDFIVTGTVWKGVSKTGNALGKLRGIYGISQPQIVVEYGNFSSAANTVEEVSMVAYFDLQTGKLKQLVKFD